MGTTVGGVIGAVIGFVVTLGNPAGAQIGFMIGAAIGGAIKPNQVQGPKLADTPIQTSREGIPIPIGWGIIHTRGNIIQINPLQEVETTESQGKGGGTEVTSTEYYRTFAIGICRGIDGPISGIRRIWENDKLVYDARAHALFEYPVPGSGGTLREILDNIALAVRLGIAPPTWFNAWMWQNVDPSTLTITPKEAALFAAQLMVYYGTEDQLPDPELEAHWGADWTPAFKGLAYAVWNNYNLTKFGAAIPNYRFEVLVNGNGIITSRVYPLEAIDQLKIGCSAPFGEMRTVPFDQVDQIVTLQSIVRNDVLITGSSPPDQVDQIVTLQGIVRYDTLIAGSVDPDQVDQIVTLEDITRLNALVKQIVPPEGLQIDCSAPTGSMTPV